MPTYAFWFILTFLASTVYADRTREILDYEHDWPEVPGGSHVKLCPTEHTDDILVIDKIVDDPPQPYLNDAVQVSIYGNFTRNLTKASTVDWEFIAVANDGQSASRTDRFHICDYLEELRQHPHSRVVKSCPPTEGPALLNYQFWFANWLVAPGRWLVKFDVKTPEGEPIYCLVTDFDLQCSPDYHGRECLRGSDRDL